MTVKQLIKMLENTPEEWSVVIKVADSKFIDTIGVAEVVLSKSKEDVIAILPVTENLYVGKNGYRSKP